MSENPRGRDPWEKADAVASIASKLLIPIVLVIIADLLSSGLREREAKVNESELSRAWVELALSVLKDDGFADQRDMREWSVAVINNYVPERIRIPGALRDGLVDGSVSFPSIESRLLVGPQIVSVQSALQAAGLCGPGFFADAVAGPMTWACLADYLGDGATRDDARNLLAGTPEMVTGWITAGPAPADWRAQAAEAQARATASVPPRP
jgi:hypothetical protein